MHFNPQVKLLLMIQFISENIRLTDLVLDFHTGPTLDQDSDNLKIALLGGKKQGSPSSWLYK